MLTTILILNLLLLAACIRYLARYNVAKIKEEKYPIVLKPGNVPTLLVGECNTCGAVTGYTPAQVGTYNFASCGERGCYGSTQPFPHDSKEGKVIYAKLVDEIEKKCT